jgi:hypothetical protein
VDNSNSDNLLKSHLTMKSLLIYAVLLASFSCSAIAADPATPMADIEPRLANAGPVERPVALPAQDAPGPASSGLDDFSLAVRGHNIPPKGDELNSSQPLQPQRHLPHLEGF